MNRILLFSLAVLGAAMPLVMDSALKGAALLGLAALSALLLWRASAAARHLVWLVAVVALLLVPLLSILLPGWRVLPQWAVAPSVTVQVPAGDFVNGPSMPHEAHTFEPTTTPTTPALPPAFPETPALPEKHAAPPSLAKISPPPPASDAWRTALPGLWMGGCGLLLLRLLGAHWLLRKASRGCVETRGGILTESLASCARHMGVCQPIRLLLDEKRIIPVVWGVWRPRLILPAEAIRWDAGQLQSVFFHELAHIRRRDTLVQWITQLACAFHWFNPLVWLAAWRLHVERERACDDLVLASGVKASAYAGHLLRVASQLSPARWTAACGLAMARKSSLESRLMAVLSEKLNRRGVTSALAGIALLLGAGIAIPVAMLRAAEEQWNPPQSAHIGGNDFSTLSVRDGKETAFILAYQGDFDSMSSGGSNSKTRTWTNSGEITAKKPGIVFSFHRVHTAPDKLILTSAPSDARELDKPSPPPRDFGQKEYDLTKGRIFLLSDNGDIRQIDIAALVVTDQKSAMKLAALIAAIQPQQGAPAAKLTREMLEGIWTGERDGVNFEIRFRWYSEHQQAHWLVRKGGHTVGLDTSVLLDTETGTARFVFRKGIEFEHEYGQLSAGEGGVLLLDVTPNSHAKDPSPITSQKGIVLTRQPGEARLGPEHKDARGLYEIWQRYERANGDIPGALIGELAAAVKVFIGYNPTYETVPQLNALLPRLDATHDWKAADAIALLDEVAAVKDSPLTPAPWKGTRSTIRKGDALPNKFADVAWGEAQPNGLRAALVLEPSAAEHRIGAALKARLLVQNSGQVPVMVQVPTFHQGGVKATDAKGAEVEVSGISWTTMALLNTVRLGPGAHIEINTPGIGFGPRAGMGPWAGPRVGSNVLAKPGDELTLTHSPVPLDGSEVGVSEDDPHVSGPGWWLAHIKTRLARELPLPADAAERTRLLDRAVRELFAAAPTAEETAAFVADTTPDALDALVKRLAAREDVVSFSGKLPTAPAKFRVLAADPAADKMPRVVLGAGEYPLSEGTKRSGAATLKIVSSKTNDAQLVLEATEATGALPPAPHKLELPDGWGTWAIVCRPNDGFLYVLHKGGVRKIDYSDPHPKAITDIPATDLPAEFRDEVKRQLEIAGVPDAQQAEIFEKPAPPAATPGPKPRIRGKVLKPDGSPAVGVQVRVDDGIERWKFRGPEFPDLPRPVKTADDGTFSIEMPKGWVAENYEAFASSDDFPPLNAKVPAGGDVGMMQFAKGSRVTGRVIGLDGAGLAKVGIWCRRLDWRGRGPAPTKLTSTGADGTFSIPPIAPGRHVLQIITRDLGAKELAVAFANPVIEAKDDAPVEVEIRPLPTVDLTLDARVIRGNAEFRDFEVRVSGTLPGAKAGDPAAYWTRQETTKLAEGKHSIAVPAGLQNASVRADGIYMRKGDAPVFIWQRGSDAQPATASTLELGLMDKPQTISVTVRDAKQAEIFEKPAPPATTPAPKTGATEEPKGEAPPQPKHESAQSLFRKWQASARTDGKIPGALIGHVAREVDGFLKRYPDDEKTPQLAALRPQLDASRDWAQAEVVALLDDITAISTAPVSWASTPMEFDKARAVQGGKPLPAILNGVAWGKPAANGLRAAWLLEPAPEVVWTKHVQFLYRHGTVLKARVLFHNTGKAPVVFKTETWHQDDKHTARDAKGAEISVKATWFTGITPMATFRLAPGEYCEVSGHGIAIGAGEYKEEHSTGAVGAIIEAKVGDAVTLTHSVDTTHGGWTRPNDPKDPAEFWKMTIAERIANEAPMPRAAADRAQLIRRVTLDIFGVVPTAEEIAAFTADDAPDALASLTARLQAKPRVEPFAGKLPTGETKFRVIAADPNAAKAPRTANSPGRYVLGDGVQLQVTQTTDGAGRTNKATIIFVSPDPKVASPHKPYQIALPDGIGTYGIVWDRGSGALWVMQKGMVRKYEFANPSQVQEMKIEPGNILNIPAHLQEPMKKAFDVPGAPVQKQMPVKPATAGTPQLPKLPDDAYARLGFHFQKFREEDAKRPGGERMGAVLEPSKPEDRDKEPLVLGVRTASDAQWRIGGTAKVGLVVRNRTGGIGRNQPGSDVKFSYTGRLDNGLSVVAVDEAGKEHGAVIGVFDGEFAFQQMLLPVAHVATIKGFTIRFDAEKRGVSDPRVAAFHLPPGKYKLRCKWNDARPEVAHEGEWTGELVNEELAFTLAAAAPPPAAATEKPTADGAALTPETEAQLDWGEAVNGLRAAVVVRSPQPGTAPGIFLAVQNVSAAALRFTDSMAAKEQRKLYLSDSAGILAALTSGEPTKTDAVLPPRGVLFLPMFPSDLEKKGEAALIEGIRKDSLQTWRAVLNIENAPEGAWKGKLTTAETRGAVSAEGPQPKTEAARALFKFWQRSARLNGDIPGGLLARLHDKVKEFIGNNTGDASGDPYAKKMAPLEPRFGPAGDWKPVDVVALLDDIAAVTTIPLKTTLLHHGEHTLRHGQPLPAALEKADWGEPLAGGLRMAFLLEPRAAEYHLGTEVKARILLHNSGKEAVAFITSSFHQPGHKAHLADGGELKLDGTTWFTRSLPQAWRLAPGEYIEVNTPGLGIGAHDKERAEWSDVRAGSWILCKVGDEVTLLPGAVMLTSKETPIDPDWWLAFITERLEREAPVPLDTKEREYLLYRVVRELFGTAPSTTEGDAFAADKSPDALKNLAVLLTKHQYGTRCEGPISAGETKFRVLPPDPDADKKPRVAMNPGRYTLGGSTTLVVTRRPDGRRIVNEAHLSYNSPPEEGIPAPHHKIELPDGYDTWAAASMRGEKVLWLSQKGRLLKIDFTNFGKIQETRYEGDNTATAPIPADIREALRAALTVPDAPKQVQVQEPLKLAAATPASPAASAPALEGPKTEKPKDGAAPDAAKRIPPATEQKLKWGEPVNGLCAALVMQPVPDEPDAEDKNDIFLVVQNVTKAEVWLHASDTAPNPRQLIWREKGILETINEVAKPVPADFRLQPGEVAFFRMTHPPAKPDGRNGGSAIAASIHRDPTFDLTGKMEIEKAPAGAWTGTLLSGEIKGGTAIPVLPAVEELKDTKPANAKLADDHYAKSGVPLAEQAWPMPPWGAEKDGLSAGLRIIGDARIGGEVKAEVWVLNTSAKDVKFSQNPRADVGLSVVAKDKDGKEHRADIASFRGKPGFHHLLLPPGHVVKVKEFAVHFDTRMTEMQRRMAASLPLPPGEYKLRAVWSDTTSMVAPEGEWTGKIATGEVDLKIAAQVAAEEADANNAKPAADGYVKSGVPVGDLLAPMTWSAEQNGLCLGMHIPEDADWRIGKAVKVELWVRNPGVKDVKFENLAGNRNDLGLRVLMTDKDGKEHEAGIAMIRTRHQMRKLLLPARHVVKVREFSVTLAPPDARLAVMNPVFALAPGEYIFRCEHDLMWTVIKGADGKQLKPAADVWTGLLKSGEVNVKLAAANAGADAGKPAAKPPGEKIPKLPDSAYAKVGTPIGELDKPIEWSGVVTEGLCMGIHVPEDAVWRVGGEVKAEVWVYNASETDVKFSHSPRTDVGLSIIAKGADGKEHFADITQFLGYPVFSHMLLPAGNLVKLKELTMKLGAKKDGERVNLDLSPGDYKLRAVWSDTTSMAAPEGEWTGKIATGEVALTIAPPESPRADVKPDSRHLFNEDYAAIAVQSAKDVNFVLFYNGFLSSGMTEWSSGKKWRFEGDMHLVDLDKTKAAGKSVDKRVVALKYTSDAPTKLLLDGKEFDLSPTRGRIFILRDKGEPIQTARTLPLGDAKDLAAIGEFAAQWLKDAAAKAADDSYPSVGVAVADIPVGNIEWCEEQNGMCVGLLVPEDREWRIGGEAKVELWVCNPGEKDVKFHHNGRNDIGLRVFLKGADGKEHAAEIAQFRGYPVFTKHLLKAGHAFKAKAFTVQLGKPQNITANPWFDLPAGDYKFRCEVKIPGSTVSTAGKQIIPAEGEWSGTIKSSEVVVKLVAANAGADAGKPAAKPTGADIVKVPDDQYVKSGFPVAEVKDVVWNETQNGLSLGYRITADEWRILGKPVNVEVWVRNPGDKGVKFQLNMRPDIGLRLKLKGEKDEEREANIVPDDRPPFGEHRLLPAGHALKVKEFTVSLLWPENDVSGIKGHYFAIDPGAYNFHCELELPGFSATGEGGKQLTPAAGEWKGKLTTRSLNVVVVAPDAPAPKPRIEHVSVRIGKDGEVSLDRKKMPLDELKTRAARNAKKWFTIEADEDVPYAKVIEVVEALKAVGVTEFSFAEARVGDGKYRVANRQATYDFDAKHRFSICRPGERPQWFTVGWPAEGARPACALRTFPNVSGQSQGKWAVVWEPGTDVLWWVDDTDVGKMTLTDPAQVMVHREGRGGDFSRDFGLPDGVVTEFRRLGFVVGRIGQTGPDDSVNTSSQSIVSAEAGTWMVEGSVKDAEDRPVAGVPLRVQTEYAPDVEIGTATTDAAGKYRISFHLTLDTLQKFRAVLVKPVKEGFIDRDLAESGQFNALLRKGEKPRRPGDEQDIYIGPETFAPGEMRRFAERDLVQGQPETADFVLVPTGEITGQIVDESGKGIYGCGIAVAVQGQRKFDSVAMTGADENGRFRLSGVPFHKPLTFHANPSGHLAETSQSEFETFEPAASHEIRVVIPKTATGFGRPRIEWVNEPGTINAPKATEKPVSREQK